MFENLVKYEFKYKDKKIHKYFGYFETYYDDESFFKFTFSLKFDEDYEDYKEYDLCKNYAGEYDSKINIIRCFAVHSFSRSTLSSKLEIDRLNEYFNNLLKQNIVEYEYFKLG